MSQKIDSQNNLHKAIFFIMISITSFTVMNAVIKELSQFSVFQLVFFRSIGTFFICLFFLVKMGIPVLGNQKKLLSARAFFGTIAMFGFFIAIKLIPFGSAVTFRYLAPIFAAILAVIILKEKIRPVQWLFFIMSFVGVLLLKSYDVRINLIGLISILISAICTGLVYVLIRKIGDKDHPLVVVIYFMFFTMLTGGILSIFNWRMPTGLEWGVLLSMGIFGFFGQFFMTKGLQIAETSKIAPVKYMEAVFALIVGYFWFEESYSQIAFVGIILIILGMVLNVFSKKE